VHIIDIIIVAVLVLPAVVGAIYGFLNILFSLIAWILALGIAMKLYGAVSPFLEPYVNIGILRDLLAFIALFIVSLLILSAVGYFLMKLVGRSGLTATDRILGFVFGVGLGGAIVTVAVFLAGFTSVPTSTWWHESALIQPFQQTAVWARRFLPANVVEDHRYDGK
jgi:membrane protein required for colicin V production